jgi:hypothetical protein
MSIPQGSSAELLCFIVFLKRHVANEKSSSFQYHMSEGEKKGPAGGSEFPAFWKNLPLDQPDMLMVSVMT